MTDAPDGRSVFVVHGRNDELRVAMFEFLRSINLAPIEWTRAIQLTSKGSPYIGEVLDAAFRRATAIVVLITPDEVAYLQPRFGHGGHDPAVDPAPQARPNVLFEAGMAIGRDADRTILVEVGDVRPFSDVAGRHTVRLGNDVPSRQALALRLETAGCLVDLTGTDWHSTGDFSPPPPPGDGLALGRRVPAAPRRSALDFDVRYVHKGGNKFDKLQVINRGSETACEVTVSLPSDAALGIVGADTLIAKIPGGRKSVSLDVMNHNRRMGGPRREYAFDVTIAARTDGGESFSQDVFVDVNG